MAPSASSNRRLSQQGRRHSRTESILDTGLVNGQFMPIPESWSFPPKSPGSAPPLSSSTSATGSPMSLAQQHQHQMMQRQPSNPPPVQSSSSNTGMSHARRGSRHSRQLSLATRRESMDLMAGLNLGAGNGPLVHQDPPAEEERDDPEEQRRGALDALEGRATPPRPTEQPAPEKKSTSTTAASAAAPPAETVAPISTPLSPNMFQSSFGPISNKRASWGPISMTPEPTNNPVSDLGSVMEEEEEEEGVSDLPVRTPVAASKRPRPTSLFFQPNPRRTSLLAENTTPSSASGGFPPTDSAISMRPDVPESPAPVREIGSRRGLKSLSLSMSPHSPASSPANASNNNSAALSSSSPASADQSTTKQQRRQSGLRSLTLSSQGAGLPSSPSLSEVAASPLSTVSASASAANASNSPLTNRRQSLMALGGGSSRSRASSITSSAAGLGSSSNSKRAPKASSISYRHNGEPAIASWQQRMAHTPAGTPVDDDDRSEWGANDSEFGGAVSHTIRFPHCLLQNCADLCARQSESMRSGPSAAQSAIAALRSQVNDLQQEAQVLREELATAKALHASSTASAADAATTLEGRLAELQTRLSESTEHHKLSQGQLETELAEVRGQLEDAVSERDALADDVEGWRSRCADLTAALDREKQALDTEKKDGALAREKVRKLGDKLAAVSGAQEAAEEKDDALTTAQAKLINEMRDQIFSLAGALDQEKRQHASAAQQLQVLQNEQSWQLPSHNDSVDASTASSFLRSSLGSSFGGGDESSFTSMSSFDSTLGGKPEFSSSVNGPGGLHTLAEEDEEEGELDLEAGPDDGAWSDEDDGVPELDFRGTQTHAEHLQKGQPGSTSSSVSLDINETRTPPPPQEPQPTHHRSDSFIKQWTFPRGKVTPLNMLEPEDHSFFSRKSSPSFTFSLVAACPLTLPFLFHSVHGANFASFASQPRDARIPQLLQLRPCGRRRRATTLAGARSSLSSFFVHVHLSLLLLQKLWSACGSLCAGVGSSARRIVARQQQERVAHVASRHWVPHLFLRGHAQRWLWRRARHARGHGYGGRWSVQAAHPRGVGVR